MGYGLYFHLFLLSLLLRSPRTVEHALVYDSECDLSASPAKETASARCVGVFLNCTHGKSLAARTPRTHYCSTAALHGKMAIRPRNISCSLKAKCSEPELAVWRWKSRIPKSQWRPSSPLPPPWMSR